VASRKANQKLIAAKKPAKSAPIPAPQREVTMTRNYELDGLKVTVTPDGGIPKDGMPKAPFTAAQVMAMVMIFNRIAEANTLFGVL